MWKKLNKIPYEAMSFLTVGVSGGVFKPACSASWARAFLAVCSIFLYVRHLKHVYNVSLTLLGPHASLLLAAGGSVGQVGGATAFSSRILGGLGTFCLL